MAEAQKDGTVKVMLDDYPYAEDGLLIWDALKKWNDGYLVRIKPAGIYQSLNYFKLVSVFWNASFEPPQKGSRSY